MIRLDSAKMKNAIARAKTVRPRVTRTGDRSYTVTSSDRTRHYTVNFAVTNGHKLAECDCKAGQAGMICLHVAAAAAVNIAVHSNYSRPSSSPKDSADGIPIKRPGSAVTIEGWTV